MGFVMAVIENFSNLLKKNNKLINKVTIFSMLILSACNDYSQENNIITKEDTKLRLTKNAISKLENNESELYLFIKRLEKSPNLILEKWWLSPDILTPSDVTMNSMEYYNDGYKKIRNKETILVILNSFLKNYQNSEIISLENSIEEFKLSRAFFKFSNGRDYLIISIPDSYNEKSKSVICQILIQSSNGKIILFPKKFINPHFLIETGV